METLNNWNPIAINVKVVIAQQSMRLNFLRLQLLFQQNYKKVLNKTALWDVMQCSMI
jgi:hypothetical protein